MLGYKVTIVTAIVFTIVLVTLFNISMKRNLNLNLLTSTKLDPYLNARRYLATTEHYNKSVGSTLSVNSISSVLDKPEKRKPFLSEDRVIAVYTPPKGETPKKRYPQAVIIGYAKCGTRALLNYISIHPYVVSAGSEKHFYDQDVNFHQGYKWYLNTMPLSYSDQITIEKTPAYVETPRALTEMRERFPKVKIICLVCDPVVRLLSQDAQSVKKHPDLLITDLFLNGQGQIDREKHFLNVGIYYETLSNWFKVFPRDQVMILSGEEVKQQPLKSVQRVTTFLGLEPLYNKANFVFNSTKGFYCMKNFEPVAEVQCLDESKGREHRYISPKHEKMLYDFYKPHNEKLFHLLNETFNWDKPNRYSNIHPNTGIKQTFNYTSKYWDKADI